MLEISKWTSSALLLIVSVSVLIGLRWFGSPAGKNRICYQCDKTDPDCEEKVKCKHDHQVCAQVFKNGEFIFKGCSPEKKFEDFQIATVCPRKTWREWEEALERGTCSATGNMDDEWQKVLDDMDSNLEPGDCFKFKMIFCGTDECNNKEQLQRSKNNSSSSSSGTRSATDSGKCCGTGSGSGSGSGNKFGNGKSPFGSQLLREFEMTLEVIQKMLPEEGKIKLVAVDIEKNAYFLSMAVEMIGRESDLVPDLDSCFSTRSPFSS